MPGDRTGHSRRRGTRPCHPILKRGLIVKSQIPIIVSSDQCDILPGFLKRHQINKEETIIGRITTFPIIHAIFAGIIGRERKLHIAVINIKKTLQNPYPYPHINARIKKRSLRD